MTTGNIAFLAIAVAGFGSFMVGLLYALPNTQLTRRLAQEGRLHPFVEGTHRGSADQCSQGLNFETLRPRREILALLKDDPCTTGSLCAAPPPPVCAPPPGPRRRRRTGCRVR